MVENTINLIRKMHQDLLIGCKNILSTLLEETDGQEISINKKNPSLPIYTKQGKRVWFQGLSYNKPTEVKLYESDFYVIVLNDENKKIYLSLNDFDNYQLFRILDYLKIIEKML